MKKYFKIYLFATIIVACLVLGMTLDSAFASTTGSLSICRVVVDEGDNVITSKEGLPEGTFMLPLYYKSDALADVVTLDSVVFDISQFAPNKKVMEESDVEETYCITLQDLEYGYYYYLKEQISGEQWSATQYNDEYETSVSSLVNFYNHSDDGNVDADGFIDIGKSRPTRTLMLLNRYSNDDVENASVEASSQIAFGSSGSGRKTTEAKQDNADTSTDVNYIEETNYSTGNYSETGSYAYEDQIEQNSPVDGTDEMLDESLAATTTVFANTAKPVKDRSGLLAFAGNAFSFSPLGYSLILAILLLILILYFYPERKERSIHHIYK